jgi:hypothetical protein
VTFWQDANYGTCHVPVLILVALAFLGGVVLSVLFGKVNRVRQLVLGICPRVRVNRSCHGRFPRCSQTLVSFNRALDMCLLTLRETSNGRPTICSPLLPRLCNSAFAKSLLA